MTRDADQKTRPHDLNRESGFALLMALFLVASLILFAAIATPSILTEGRREKEQESIWRGKQYVRAIGLYYKKNGVYPQTIEDLAKADAAGDHYLRKSYQDPMNAADGSWRFIYVSPTGQLTGSVHYHSLQEMALSLMPGGQPTTVAGATTAAQAAQSGFQTAPTSQGQGQAQGSQAQTGQGLGQSQSQTGQTNQSFGSGFGQPAPATPLEAVDGPVLGGFLIGVASKVKRPSLIVYQGGKTYFDWEFIWNPLLNGSSVGQPGSGIMPGASTNVPVNPSGTATGGSPGTPLGSQNPDTSSPPPPPAATLPSQTPPDNSPAQIPGPSN